MDSESALAYVAIADQLALTTEHRPWAEEAVNRAMVIVDPLWDPLREELELKTILTKMGLV